MQFVDPRLLAMLFVMPVAALAAQARLDHRFDPLEIPTDAVLRCRSVPHAERQGGDTLGAYLYEFRIGKELGPVFRHIIVLFDSGGAARSLRENDVSHDASGGLVIDGVVAEFTAHGVFGVHAHTDDSTMRRLTAHAPDSASHHFTKALGPIQQEQARRLSDWLRPSAFVK